MAKAEKSNETVSLQEAADYGYTDVEPEVAANLELTDAAKPTPVYTYQSAPMTTGEKTAAGVVVTLIAAAIAGCSWLYYKEDQKYKAELEEQMAEMKRKREEREAWFEKQRAEGKIVIETADGEYMSIPAEAYASSEVRKKAL